MKNRLTRPTAALFPLACGVGAYLGRGSFMAYYFALQLFSLCAVDCFRNAATREPGVRRVDRRFGGAFLPLIAGGAVLAALWNLCAGLVPGGVQLAPALAAGLILIEQLFEERMYALGRRIDGVLLSCVVNGLLTAGFLLDWASGAAWSYLLGAAALGAAASVVTNYAIERPHGFSLLPRNLGDAPLACVQTLLYPLALAALEWGFHPYELLKNPGGVLGAAPLYGLMLWRLARAPHRRTADESRAMHFVLLALACVPAAASEWVGALAPAGVAGILGLICGAAVFCAPTRRFVLGLSLAAAMLLPPPFPGFPAALALVALAMNARGAFLKKR